MFALLSYFLLAAVVGIGFFDLRIAWGLLAIAIATLLSLCWAFLGRNQGYEAYKDLTGVPVDNLTEQAAEMVRRYWAFYTSPQLGIQLGGAAAAVAVAAAALGIIGAFEQFWWGLVVAALIWIVSLRISSRVNPTNRFLDPALKATHEEVKKVIAEALLDRMKKR